MLTIALGFKKKKKSKNKREHDNAKFTFLIWSICQSNLNMFLYKGNLTHGLLGPQVVIKYPQSSIYHRQNTKKIRI